MGVLATPLPYCGAAPTPLTLAGRWNLDPILLAALAAFALAYAVRARTAGIAPWRRRCAAGGWTILTLALVSPLCPLSVALFSARVGQHMILTLLAAPLVALGRPLAATGLIVGRRPAATPLAAAAAFAALLWLWHAPVPYDLTFASALVYWAMHVTMIASAVWLWGELLAPAPDRLVAAAGGAFTAMAAMSLLGAVITFAPRPLYAPHATTTQIWGLTQLGDQQMGGALMWVPGGMVFLAAFVGVAWRALTPHLAPVPQAAR